MPLNIHLAFVRDVVDLLEDHRLKICAAVAADASSASETVHDTDQCREAIAALDPPPELWRS